MAPVGILDKEEDRIAAHGHVRIGCGGGAEKANCTLRDIDRGVRRGGGIPEGQLRIDVPPPRSKAAEPAEDVSKKTEDAACPSRQS